MYVDLQDIKPGYKHSTFIFLYNSETNSVVMVRKAKEKAKNKLGFPGGTVDKPGEERKEKKFQIIDDVSDIDHLLTTNAIKELYEEIYPIEDAPKEVMPEDLIHMSTEKENNRYISCFLCSINQKQLHHISQNWQNAPCAFELNDVEIINFDDKELVEEIFNDITGFTGKALRDLKSLAVELNTFCNIDSSIDQNDFIIGTEESLTA